MYKIKKSFTGRRCIKSFEGFLTEARNFDLPVGPTKWADLPSSVKTDIIENVYDASDYLKKEWNIWTFKENFDDDLNPPTLNISKVNIADLKAGNLSTSDLVVDKYRKMVEDGVEMDPIILDGGKFYDGRHRLMAYWQAGKKEILGIDIAPMLKTDWKEWLENNGKGEWENA